MEDVVHCYQHDARRLLVLGYNATLTVATEAPRGVPKRTFDQMQAREASLYPTPQPSLCV